MSYNIDSVRAISSTLRISEKNARKAAKIELPELHPLDDLTFGEDGYAAVDFMWSGEGSGNMYTETLHKFVKLLEGDADLVFTWEGGDSHTGMRIRSGKAVECEVVMTLAPEKP